MDSVQIFNDELQTLLDTKPPVSKAKMGMITRAAMKGVKFYKHIVLRVEKFITKCGPEYKVPGLYVIDSIVRQSRHQFGIERDVYAMRFARNLSMTFESLFTGCLLEDKPKIVRVLNLWLKNGVFDAQTIDPIMEMARLGSSSSLNHTGMSATSPPMENDTKSGQSSNYPYGSSSSRDQRNETGLKFTKNMLDFDYGEEDDDGDETPTEAEPPLSSTLSKIEMEQREQRRSQISNQNYQTSQIQHQSSIYQQNDPVLERWTRLIRGESSSDVNETKLKRSRSRSPPSQAPLVFNRNSLTSSSDSRDFVYKPPAQLKEDISSQPVIKQNSANDAERQAEREKKCLPKIRDKHLTVCSSTLWLGHVPKTVSEADLSNAFGEYGTIASIDLIPPRGCAYVCMDRRQDAKKALSESKDLKLNGSHIKMAWAPGKGFKEYKKLKDFWEVETGSSFIPYSKVDETIDFDTLEEGGVIDEDSMSMEMRERRERQQREKELQKSQQHQGINQSLPVPCMPIMTQQQQQPPPSTSIAPFAIPPPSALSQGMIHYPPPPVSMITSVASALPVTSVPSAMPIRNDDPNETDDGDKSPSNIDQQLSMTEKQISMVEQQLNMIKQAQNMAGPHNVSQASSLPSMHPQPIFNQPNPMIFDMSLPPPQLLHSNPPLLDPNIFVNPALLCQNPPLMPMGQTSMIDPTNLHNSMMQHQQGRF